MKIKDLTDKTFLKQSAAAGLLLVIVAVITLEATALIQYYFSQKGIKEEATMRAESQLDATRNQIMDIVNQTEAAVRNNEWIAQWCLGVPDSLFRVTQRMVEDNPTVMGSTIAVVPGYLKDRPLFSPYSCRAADGSIELKSLATEDYDYPSQEWFTRPIERGEGYWSEPYIDEGGGEVLMTTYSLPIRDAKGNIAAVLTADLSLDWLTELVGNIKVYPHAFSMVISEKGQIMVCPAETLVMRKTMTEVVSSMEDTSSLMKLARAMMGGERGSMRIAGNGSANEVFFAPVERTGWSMSIVIPEDEIYKGIKRMGLMVTILQLLGIALIIFIIRTLFKNQLKFQKLNESKERLDRELQIGHNIQMSMIPKIFPPFPERKDLDMSASIVPAKEVGGDLYDFYIRDEKLLFCVGDVSGKGVPASLVMAVTRSLFRSVSSHEDSPANMVSRMNDAMSDMNESNMFVTLFLGVLDLATGHLAYCNAGHNAPLLLNGVMGFLPVVPNLPLGVMPGWEFQEQETDIKYDDALFLYTDGVTEAENIDHELYGEDRLKAVLKTRRSADDHLEALRKSVLEFVGEAPQSDDMTALFIHYLG